ncbi:MAG: urease accessory protein UreD [Sandaracinaceae bacterium]|nr:urease accessory protein UreD [Sandaracinaceae bacterium]
MGEGATLEHVPHETVVFDGAHAALRARVALDPGARFFGWEVFRLGRPACGERFLRGALRLSFEVAREGRLVLLERGRVEGGGAALDAAWGRAACPALVPWSRPRAISRRSARRSPPAMARSAASRGSARSWSSASWVATARTLLAGAFWIGASLPAA